MGTKIPALRVPQKSRLAKMSSQEMNIALRAHLAPRVMAIYDNLTSEQRELIRDTDGVIKVKDWQAQGRDSKGRFLPPVA